MFTVKSFSQALPVTQTESNPHRGVYVDQFFYIDPNALNNGQPYPESAFFPELSMLGVDQNHDGVFEKEDKFLNYCRDNHITVIVLLDLHKIIGSNIELWDENEGCMVSIEHHLCRFMNKARNRYCIYQIGAAVDNSNAARGFIDSYSHFPIPSPPLIVPNEMQSHPDFIPELMIMEDSTLIRQDSAYAGSELLKSIYRIINLNECEECETYFNYIFIEYEFWQDAIDEDYVSPAHGFSIDPACTTYCCNDRFSSNSCISDCGGAYPSWIAARYAGHFVPVVRDIRFMVDYYNQVHNYNESDNEFMRIESYSDPTPPFDYTSSDQLNIYAHAAFLDGIDPSVPFLSPPSNCPPGTTFERMIDRISMYNYYRYNGTNPPVIDPTLFQFLFDDLNNFNQGQLGFGGLTNLNTDVHPLLSAENISNNGYDNYWGEWFNESPLHNIFEAEKLFFSSYNRWQYDHDSSLPPINYSNNINENSVQRGGALWFAQSFMSQKLDNPKIFNAQIESCYPLNPPSVNIQFDYIGPTEAPLNIEFRVKSTIGANIWPANGFFNTSTDDLFWFRFNPAAPPIPAILPVSTTRTPMIAEMIVHYPGGCEYTYEEEIIVSTLPSIVAYGPIEFCEGNSVILHANNLNATVQWYLNNDQIPASQGGQNNNLVVSTSGTYECEIVGCGRSNQITVNVKPNPYVEIVSFCNNSSNLDLFAGPILNPSPTSVGPGGVTYLWSTGENTDRINVTVNGTYSVLVTASNGCTRLAFEAIRVINDPVTISYNIVNHPNSLCASDGAVTITGGNAPNHVTLTDGVNTYYHNWRSGHNFTINNLPAGYYTVYVAPGNGSCVGSVSFQLGQAETNYIVTSSTQNVTCHGGNNGSIEITGISGGQSDYVVSIPAIGYSETYSGTGTLLINNLSAGNYFIRITDNNCNWDNLMLPITQPDAMVLNITHADVTGCNNSQNGSATVSVQNGSGNYTYSWTGPVTSTSQSISNIPLGTYSVTVSQNGCSVSDTVRINAPPLLFLHHHEPFDLITCNCNAELNFCVFGGTGTYSDPTNTWSLSNNIATRSNLCPGTYTIEINDANGCTVSESVTLTSGTISLGSPVIVNPCPSQNNGSIQLPLSGGTPPYTVNSPWQLTNGIISSNGLSSGVYTVNVTDQTGCTASGSFQLTPLTLNVTTSNATCLGGNGSATATPINGNPPFTYLWSSGELTATINRPAGSYSCTVTDALNCTATVTVQIPPPVPITFTGNLTHASCIAGADGQFQILPQGGVSPFTYYMILNGTLSSQSGNTFVNLNDNTLFEFYFIDANGCESAHQTVSINHTTTNCCNFNLPLPVVSPAGNFNYVLNSNFVINSGVYVLNDNEVAIMEGVEIRVRSGATLEVSHGAHLFACGNMWAGIVLEPGATLIVNNSTIEDALIAVNASGTALFTISNNAIFDNNYIGVNMLNGNFTTSTITGTTFRCSDGFLQRVPHQNETPYAFVYMDNVSFFKLGNEASPGLRNQFTNANYGVVSIASVLEAVNNQFDGGVPYVQNSPAKAAILIRRKYNIPGPQNPVLMTYNKIGKDVNNGSNQISNWENGIDSRNASSVEVYNNTITDCAEGINIYNTRRAMVFRNYVSNNNLFQPYYTSTHVGIDVETAGGIRAEANIGENYVVNYTIGIHVNNIEKAIVGKANKIYILYSNTDVLTHNLTLHGIWLQNSPFSYVLSNNTYRFEDPDQSVRDHIHSIDIENSANSYINYNNTRKTGTGIRFLNNCNATELHCNVMLDCFHGVYLYNSSQTRQGTATPQGVPVESWGNYWNNQVNSSWDRVAGINVFNTIEWYYDAATYNGYDPNPYSPQIIDDVSGVPNGDCPDPTLVRVEPDNRDELRDIAYDSFSYDDYQSELTYSNKEYFYEILKKDTTLMYRGSPEDALFQLMYNELRSGNIGLFHEVKELAKGSDYAQALLKNQMIADTNLIESNKKVVNEISLSSQMNNTEPGPAQISILENIAYQYPIQGGEAVYKARAMLHKHVEDQLPLFRKRGKSKESADNVTGKIYPNPASKNITYIVSKPDMDIKSLKIELLDGLNRICLEKSVKMNNAINLSVESLTSGMYFYRIILNDCIIDNGKLIVER